MRGSTICSLAFAAACAAAIGPLAARADAPAGLSGRVLDEQSKKPLPGIAVLIVRQPRTGDSADSVLTDRKGAFANITLQPGRYAVTANVAGRTASCTVEDVPAGQVRRVTILVSADGRDFACEGPRVHAFTVDPNETADVYRVR